MSWISRTFLRGLVAVLPVGMTVYIVYWLVTSAETLLASVYRAVLPHARYEPGIGLAFAVALLFAVGVLLNALLVRRLYNLAVKQFERIPLIKSLYGMLRDMMGFFRISEKSDSGEVVMVKLGDAKLIGFVTRTSFEDLPDAVGSTDTVGVYLPMSYQLGGYLAMLPRSCVEPVAMKAEQALRFAITAGVATNEGDGEPGARPQQIKSPEADRAV